MATARVAIRVTGLKELRAALLELGPESEKAIWTRLLGVAGGIAGAIRSAMPHGPTGRAARSVMAGLDKKGAWVSEGAGADYVPWLDFGGSTSRGHQRGHNMGVVHREWLGKPGGEGRYLYPQIRAHQPQTLQAVNDAIKEAAEAAGFVTEGF